MSSRCRSRQFIRALALKNRPLAQIVALRFHFHATAFHPIDVVKKRSLTSLVGDSAPDGFHGLRYIYRRCHFLITTYRLDNNGTARILWFLVVRIVDEEPDLLKRRDDVA